MEKSVNMWMLCIILLMSCAYAHPHGFDVAQESLRKNYNNLGITAGTTHFSDVWARDAFFASLGANRIGDYHISKTQLETFIQHQKSDGQIPLRVGDRFIFLKFLGFTSNGEYPQYVQDKGTNPALDPNCLFVIAGWDYISTYGDWSFAKEHIDSFDLALAWLMQHDTINDTLLEQEGSGDWADSLRKDGEVLYTNVCYYKALIDMQDMLRLVREVEVSNSAKEELTHKEEHYASLSNRIRVALNEHFYNGQYYIDGYGNREQREWFSTDGNVLAILWGVADEEQAKSIIDYAQGQNMSEYFSVLTNTPEIPLRYVDSFIVLVGMKDYHRQNVLWPWQGVLYCLAKEKVYEGTGEACLDRISAVYDKHGVVYEVYDKWGEPIDKLLYNAEQNFAWGSGLFIYAHEEMRLEDY